jgi:hypothetical protein
MKNEYDDDGFVSRICKPDTNQRNSGGTLVLIWYYLTVRHWLSTLFFNSA